jgi:hypothetical protein
LRSAASPEVSWQPDHLKAEETAPAQTRGGDPSTTDTIEGGLMNEQDYLTKRLDDQRQWLEGKSAWNQTWYKRLRVVEVVLAAAIPFFSSLMGKFPESPNVIPILVSAMAFLIAAASALLALYRFQENWLRYRGTAEQLAREKFLFMTKTQPYDGSDAFQVLVAKVENILGEENSTWREEIRNPTAQPSPGDVTGD